MEKEWAYVAARREASEVAPRRTLAGLALSGGGIRSATFSLGILQALSRCGLTRQLDYISTVSGGSYIGSFFGALYVEPELRCVEEAGLDDAARKTFRDHPLQSPRGRKAVARLREFGRYLTPGGFSDTLYGMSLVARNWIALQLVLGMVPLLFFLAIRLVQRADTWRYFTQDERLIQTADWASGSSISMALLLLLGAAILCSAALATGYWYTRFERVDRSIVKRVFTGGILLAAMVAAATLAYFVIFPRFHASLVQCLHSPHTMDPITDAPAAAPCPDFLKSLVRGLPLIAVTGTLILSIAAYVYFAFTGARNAAKTPNISVRESEDNVRGRMTRALATSNLFVCIFAALVVIDLLGSRLALAVANFPESLSQVAKRFDDQDIYAGLRVAWRDFWPFLVVLAPAALTVWANRALRRGTGTGWLSRPSGQGALGGSILFLWLVIWAATARAMPDPALPRAFLVVLLLLVIELFCYGFLNLSSLVTLYSARLKRAYVGASNPLCEAQGFDVDRPGDRITMDVYYDKPAANSEKPLLNHLRPVHLINCTIAQTEPEGASQVVAYDRKGKPLQVSPAGIVHQAAAAGMSAWRAFENTEQLSLSSWTAISGAAASTAIGSLTSLGLSILAMMANVRLGYWWKASASTTLWPKKFFEDTMLGYLVSELQGRFATEEDRKRRWYLTDGGHFENTGAYGLIQRRLDLIVICDNGADPDYRLDDVVRLIDRARTDLNAEIDFLENDELDRELGQGSALRQAFGSYRELARPPVEGSSGPNPYAALARVRYDIDLEIAPVKADEPKDHASDEHSPRCATLILIKPRLNFTEPPELLAYQRRDDGRNFPQQTTLDQFFDEEQWEAYRRFGEVVGERVFSTNPDGWSPRACMEGRAGCLAERPGGAS